MSDCAATLHARTAERALRPGWILGPRADAAIFTGPILVAGAFVAFAWADGWLHAPVPPWAFALLIVGCDVAHVYATAFRVYLDPRELRRRPALYLGVPLACLGAGVALHGTSPMLFWRVLAYLAAFHFVRQQWGWVAYARRKAGESGRLDRVLDEVAIYNATLFPLLYWHASLPRAFVWFLEGDFAAGVPPAAADVGHVVHWTIVAVYVARQVWRAASGLGVNQAKLQIQATTWIAWYGGIVLLDSDVAFTAFNVLSHGVPYLAVVHALESSRRRERTDWITRLFRPRYAAAFLGALWLAGYVEEWTWDKLVWHEHAGLFPGIDVELPSALVTLFVALLAVPQATHYVLDGWIWRTRGSADLRAFLSRKSE